MPLLRSLLALLAGVAALAAVSARAAPPVTIKLATLAPSGSAWHDLLKELRLAWERASDGRV